MGLTSLDDDTIRIRRRHQRTAAITDHAGAHVGEHVQTKNGFRLVPVEHALFDHETRTAFLADRRTLLSGLKQKDDLAW
jgi:hypothetical protein